VAITANNSVLEMISLIKTSEIGLYKTKTSLYQMNEKDQNTMARMALKYIEKTFFVINTNNIYN
jgi:hypothetical protein